MSENHIYLYMKIEVETSGCCCCCWGHCCRVTRARAGTLFFWAEILIARRLIDRSNVTHLAWRRQLAAEMVCVCVIPSRVLSVTVLRLMRSSVCMVISVLSEL